MTLYTNISIVILSILLILFIFLTLRYKFMYFSKMDFSNVFVKHYSIDLGDIIINAEIYLPKYMLDEKNYPKSKLPLIFINHGMGMEIDSIHIKEIASGITLGGPYACLAYDCRGHGKTEGIKRLNSKMFDDIPKIIDFAANLSFIDKNMMGFIGVSMGAEIALTRAYIDQRIKAIVSISSPHNPQTNFLRKPKNMKEKIYLFILKIGGVNGKNISDRTAKSISPQFIIQEGNKTLNERVMLIIAENDSLISFEEFKKNKKMLGLGSKNVMILKKGNHTLLHQEITILSASLRFFHEKL